ncbi:MAG: DUF3048 domain-containing protein [Anaerolineales bacterium]
MRKPFYPLVVLGLVLAACSSATPTLPPANVSVNEPTLPPAVISTSAAPTSAPTIASAGPTAIPLLGPDSYPENVNPLTGEQVDPVKLNRIPVAVKISNFPVSARPQWGLAPADLVFEHLAEGGNTRFTAIYLQNDVVKVGPIRSMRYIDAELPPMFGAVLVTSGSSTGTMQKIRSRPWFSGEGAWRLVSEESANNCPPLCRETPNDINTLFTNTDSVRQVLATETAQALDRPEVKGLKFDPAAPQGNPGINEVYIRFSGAAQVTWKYNAGTGRYDRWQEKAPNDEQVPHVEAATNAQLTAANVVLAQVNQVNNLVLEDTASGNLCGLEIQFWYSGPARVFRDGQMIEGAWLRDESTGWQLRLLDQAGNPLALKPGNTWFGLITLNSELTVNSAQLSVLNKVPDTSFGC